MSEIVKAVVFDVGEVLFHWNMRALFEKVIAEPERLEHFMAEVLTYDLHSRHDAGEELELLVAELVERHPVYSEAINAYAHRFNETITGPVAGMHELVGALAARGVPLYAITNFPARFWAEFARTEPVIGHFRDVVVSGVEKLAKPDPAIFRLAERRFGHAPGELLFTDDREDNIAAARACGWQAHHFTGAEGLAAELKARGLLG